jgi:hypothetical protein
MQEIEQVETFLVACSAYRAWLDCGKNLIEHQDLFDAYDKAVDDFTHSLYPIFIPNTSAQRQKAFHMVWDSVTQGGMLK